MRKAKYLIMPIVFIYLILVIPIVVKATDEITSSSVINDVTVNWSYTINEANEIEDLKCTNVSELVGNITIPSTLDGKTVVSIGNEGFKSSTGLTGLIIPDSVKTIGLWSFENCTNLKEVDLGSIEQIKESAFKGCTSLESIIIPKTLKSGAAAPVFRGCEKLTTITLEEGMTIVPSYICAETNIESIVIPKSVSKIDYSAFEECTKIQNITIPDSVKIIYLGAFKNCTNLKQIDLGSIEEISDAAFQECTSLENIVIPKTLKSGAADSVFSGCEKLTTITLEEGMTIVPSYICAETNITEITIPNSVTEIGQYAFKDCTKLEKVSILDNVNKIGFYISQPQKDTVFTNHNENLTIYCYEGSLIAQYAIDNNIKYEYLPRTILPDEENDNQNNKEQNGEIPNTEIKNNNTDNKQEEIDTTIAPGKLPDAGLDITIAFIIVFTIVGAIVLYNKHRKLNDI